MNTIDRRNLLKLGLAGAAGLTVPAGNLLGQEEAEPPSGGGERELQRLHASYLIQPGIISRVEGESSITTSAPWALPSALAGLSGDLEKPVVPNLEALTRWASGGNIEEVRFSGDLGLAQAIQAPVLGGLPMTNLIGDALGALLDGKDLDLSLAFSEEVDESTGRRIDLSNGLPFVINDMHPNRTSVSATENRTFKVPFTKWRLTMTGPEEREFGKCVREKVIHFNLHIQYQRPNRPGRYQDVKNFHLGTYRSGSQRCFALYNSVKPGVICWKKCSPKSSDLKSILTWTLLLAATIVGVALSASAASAMAATAAAVFFPILIAL